MVDQTLTTHPDYSILISSPVPVVGNLSISKPELARTPRTARCQPRILVLKYRHLFGRACRRIETVSVAHPHSWHIDGVTRGMLICSHSALSDHLATDIEPMGLGVPSGCLALLPSFLQGRPPLGIRGNKLASASSPSLQFYPTPRQRGRAIHEQLHRSPSLFPSSRPKRESFPLLSLSRQPPLP